MTFEYVVSHLRKLEAKDWGLDSSDACNDAMINFLNEGLVCALHAPSLVQARAIVNECLDHAGLWEFKGHENAPRRMVRNILQDVNWRLPRPQYRLLFRGDLYLVVTGSPSNPNDMHLQGVYLFRVDPSRLEVTDPVQKSVIAFNVVNSFRVQQSIAHWQDFSVKLFTADGAELGVEDDATPLLKAPALISCGQIYRQQIPPRIYNFFLDEAQPDPFQQEKAASVLMTQHPPIRAIEHRRWFITSDSVHDQWALRCFTQNGEKRWFMVWFKRGTTIIAKTVLHQYLQ